MLRHAGDILGDVRGAGDTTGTQQAKLEAAQKIIDEAPEAFITESAGSAIGNPPLQPCGAQHLEGAKLLRRGPGDAIGKGTANIDRETPSWSCLAHQETESNRPAGRSAISILLPAAAISQRSWWPRSPPARPQ